MTEFKRPSLREAARRGVEAKKQAQASQVEQPAADTPAGSAAPAPATPAAVPTASRPAPFQKVKPPVVGVEQVTVKCGHVVPFELFDLGKDKFRKDRRKKLTDRDCTACRVKAQEVKQAAEMEEARKRRLENPKPKKEWSRPRPEGRLPDGSRFDVMFDAAKGGMVRVADCAGPDAVYRLGVGGVQAVAGLGRVVSGDAAGWGRKDV
jgi:hypothetical protein